MKLVPSGMATSERASRRDGDFPIKCILRGAVGRHQSHPVADREARDIGTNGIYDPGCLEANAGRKGRLHGRPARAKRDLGAVQANGVDTEANLATSRISDRDLLQTKNAGIAELVNAYGARHAGQPLCQRGNFIPVVIKSAP